MRIFRKFGLWLGMVALAAAVTRIYGLDWGLPNVYEEGTPVRMAWRRGAPFCVRMGVLASREKVVRHSVGRPNRQ